MIGQRRPMLVHTPFSLLKSSAGRPSICRDRDRVRDKDRVRARARDRVRARIRWVTGARGQSES